MKRYPCKIWSFMKQMANLVEYGLFSINLIALTYCTNFKLIEPKTSVGEMDFFIDQYVNASNHIEYIPALAKFLVMQCC